MKFIRTVFEAKIIRFQFIVSFSVILFGSLEAIVRSRRSLFKIAARAVKCEKKISNTSK